MIRSTLMAAAGMAVMAASPALSQAQKPAANEPMLRSQVSIKLDEAFKRMDANGDGSLNKTELQAEIDREMVAATALVKQRQQQDFQKLDTNKDGQLNLVEYQAQATVKAKPGAVDEKLTQLDTDKNQKVTLPEYRTPILAQFDKLDVNKDGTLSVQERTPPKR